MGKETGDGGHGLTLTTQVPSHPLILPCPLLAVSLREHSHHPWFCRGEAWGPGMQGSRKHPLSSWKDILCFLLSTPDYRQVCVAETT